MLRALITAGLVIASLGCKGSTNSSSIDDDAFSLSLFANPPAEFGPQTRWWWPGASVDDAGLRDQLRKFAAAGYSAIEIQPFMSALTNADLREDPQIRTVGDATFLGRLRTAACTAQDLGLHWDITLGSGWSTGGVGIDDDGARQLIAAELTLEGPSSYSGPLPIPEPPAWIEATNRVLPAIDGFDEELTLVSVIGAEVENEPEDPPATLGDIVELTDKVKDGMLSWEVPAGPHRVFAVYENRTQHFPAGGAYPGALEDARVIDHLDRRGVEAFLESEFGAWLEAVADCPPRAVFVDSFELVGELPWTTGFGAELETLLGYDLDPLLPFLFLEGGESEYANILSGRERGPLPSDGRAGNSSARGLRSASKCPIRPRAHRNLAHLAARPGD